MAAIRCVFEACSAADITAGTELKSPRVQIKQNATINVAEEQGELMSLSRSLSGALHGFWEEQEHGTTEMLSYLCHAALWCGSGSCSVCVCVCAG